MTLLSGSALVAKSFFRIGSPKPMGSSFYLTIGKIFDQDGREVDGPFTLAPGHMVQVVSAEVFDMPDNVTAHVTYKTALTKIGIWALTVGIVDPGWDGPIATSLLNFSRRHHTIHSGDEFLRVSFFEHQSVAPDLLRKSAPLQDYQKEIQKLAASTFPPTFMNSDDIAKSAGNNVLDRIRKEALVWVAALGVIFTLLQVGARYVPLPAEALSTVNSLRTEVQRLTSEVEALRDARSN